MTSDKRRRELARAKYDRQQARRVESAERRRVRQRVIAGVVVAVVVIGTVAWILTRSTSSEPSAGASPSPAASGASPVPSSSASSATSPGPSTAASGSAAPTLDCAAPGTPRADDQQFPTAPTPSDTGAAPVITFTTNCGPIAVTTLPGKAPLTVASELFLVDQGFYDNTACHRLTTTGIYVLQCGDPKGDGTGGPGYTVPDENLPADGTANYPAGTVAMANAGPGTSGSQFFIVYEDTTLPPGYTIWGNVTEGLDLVRAIAAQGVEGGSGDGAPVQPVFITSAKASAA